jgi:hypothetical protein
MRKRTSELWRRVAPKEHGAWAFVAEPLALGLLVAPSLGGCLVALGSFALFLASRPALAWWVPRRRGVRPAESLWLPVGLGAAGAAAVASGLHGAGAWASAGVAGLLALAFVLVAGRVRQLHLGRVLLGSHLCVPMAAAIILAGGGGWTLALQAVALLAARTLPTVLFARSYLGNTPDSGALRWPAVAASLLAPLAIGAAFGSWWMAAPLAPLALRAVLGLGLRRYARRPRQIGLLEAAYGALAVLVWAAALRS